MLGVLSCYDRMIITGTLPGACYAGGMTSFLNFRHIKIFDYAKVFADPWRERIRQCAHELVDAQGVTIEHVNKPHIRKEDLIAKVIVQRGKHPGLVHGEGNFREMCIAKCQILYFAIFSFAGTFSTLLPFSSL